MKIYLTDAKKWLKVNYQEARQILTSGLKREQWTTTNIRNIYKTN